MKQSIKNIIYVLEEDKQTIKNVDYLLKDSQLISNYSDIEELYNDIPEQDLLRPDYKRFFSTLNNLIYKVLITFHKNDIYPSPSLIYQYFFHNIKTNRKSSSQIISELESYLHLSGITKPTIVIYPLLSFGIEDAGLYNYFSKKSMLHLKLNNFMVCTQLNKKERFYEFLDRIKIYFKLESYQYDKDLIEHYFRSRPIDWTYKNPLLIAKVNFSSEGYYENEYHLVRYLERSITKLFVLNELVKNNIALTGNSRGFSTRIVNNFSTRDFKHYIVFTTEKNLLKAQCIPIQDKLSDFFELSNINMDIPIGNTKIIKKRMSRLSQMIDHAYLNSIGNKSTKGEKQPFYYKVRRSLSFFVRSCQSRYETDQALYLSVAFEMLYSDGQSENISNKLCRNIACLFPKNAGEVFKTVSELYHARSGVAHLGCLRDCNIDESRKLYVNAFEKMNRLVMTNKIDIDSRFPFTDYYKSRMEKILKFIP